MADIRDEILKKYQIDIKETDLISIYKISSADISDKALEESLKKARRNWSALLNSPNEDKKKAAKEHLARADVYESILRDKNLRKALLDYSQRSDASDELVGFAREFFRIVASSRKINEEDVTVFFSFYKGKGKNRKAVIAMLEKEFGLGKADSKKLDKEEDGESEEKKDEKKKKTKKNQIIASLFQESTLKDIQKCENWLESARASQKVRSAFPEVVQSLDQFLHLDQWDNVESFKEYLEGQRGTASNFRYEAGQEFSPVVDIYNTMCELAGQNDVACNYKEFVLLVRYSRLNPYMYEIMAPKEDTLRKLYEVACRYYHFDSFYDFVLNYFAPVYKNFGIYENSVKRLMKKARRSGGQGGEASGFAVIFGKEKEDKLPVFLEILTCLANLPLYLSFLLFEIVKAAAWRLRYLSPLAVIPVFPFAMHILLDAMGFDTPAARGEGMLLRSWLNFTQVFTDVLSEGILSTLLFVLVLVIACGIPVALFIYSLWQAATKMRKKLDWFGIERTYQSVINSRRKAALKWYEKAGKKASVSLAVLSLVNVILIGAIGFALSGPAARLGRIPGALSGMAQRWAYERELEAMMEEKEEETETEETEPQYFTASVTVNAANIRSGPGTDFGAVGGARRDDRLILTGNSQETGGGSLWYEVYIDEGMTQTGWISGSLIQIQE